MNISMFCFHLRRVFIQLENHPISKVSEHFLQNIITFVIYAKMLLGRAHQGFKLTKRP